MKKYLPLLGKLLVLAIFMLAIWLLYDKIRSYSLHEIKKSLHQIPTSHLIASFVLMIINYMVLIGYDWLALRAIRKKLATGRVCLVSFVGCVISYNFGALLGGSTVRYRLYSAWGFSALDIVRLVLMLAVTFWVGAMGLAGAIFMFVPIDVPPELGISPEHIRPLGAALLALCLAYLAVCAWAKGRSIHVFGKEFALPSLPLAVAQTLVAGVDLVVAASCLYALLPANSGVSFLEFLPNYLLAQVAVVLTHVPGGVGVLEVVIMNLTHGIPTNSVFAAILAFRVIYYLLPLMFAAVALGFYEIHLRRQETKNLIPEASRWFRAWLPTLLSYAVFVGGAVLCLSVVIPDSPRSIAFLRPYIPLWLLEVAHLATGLAGVLLLVLSCGLEVRKRSAWKACIFALAIGIIGALLKGGHPYEVLLLLAILFPLLVSKSIFGRRGSLVRGHYPTQWAVAVSIVMACAILLGIAIVGSPSWQENLFNAGYGNSTSRVLRTIAAEVAFLLGLALLYIKATLRR